MQTVFFSFFKRLSELAGLEKSYSNKAFQLNASTVAVSLCSFYLKNKGVVLVWHLQRHGGPHFHDGRQRDAYFGL